jgi:hypothetical protein
MLPQDPGRQATPLCTERSIWTAATTGTALILWRTERRICERCLAEDPLRSVTRPQANPAAANRCHPAWWQPGGDGKAGAQPARRPVPPAAGSCGESPLTTSTPPRPKAAVGSGRSPSSAKATACGSRNPSSRSCAPTLTCLLSSTASAASSTTITTASGSTECTPEGSTVPARSGPLAQHPTADRS